MRHKANRGGHAPGHLRETLEDYLESDNPLSRPYNKPRQHLLTEKIALSGWEEGKEVSLSWLLGQLWNCTDVLPADYCEILEIKHGSSFAQAVRFIKDGAEPPLSQ